MNPKTAAILLLAGASLVRPQAPEFEVASIKPNTSGARPVSIGSPSPGAFKAENVWIPFVISMAWNVKIFQVSGAPDWANSNRYDIDAKTGGTERFDQMRPMLQRLLHDRFELLLHHQARELPVYDLVVAKTGSKLKTSSCIAEAGTPDNCAGSAFGPASVTGASLSMAQVAAALSNALQRPVIDKTGMAGTFDVRLKWTQDQSTPGFYAPGLAPSQSELPSDGPNGSIFTAIQEQLGLKLESARGLVDVLVIDHLAPPTPN